MSSKQTVTSGSGPRRAGPETNRKGSVKRARELLESGVRSKQATSPVPRPPPLETAAHQTQWPLPAPGLQPRPLNPHPHPRQHPRFWPPRGPPPARPPRPSEVPAQVPSPSIYSTRSGQSSEASSNCLSRPARSFSHPKQPQSLPPPRPRPEAKDDSYVSPTGTNDMTPRTLIATDDPFRQPSASSTVSVQMPMPEAPVPSVNPRDRTAGLTTPNARSSQARRSSVSPIPVSEGFVNPRQTLESLASSRAIPSSWGSGPAESEILGTCLDNESDEDEHTVETGQNQAETLVRTASWGKRQKPTMRTIITLNLNSKVSIPDLPSSNPRDEWNKNAAAESHNVGAAVSQALHVPSVLRRGSTSTTESSADPEKPRFADIVHDSAAAKGIVEPLPNFPQNAPTMSAKRPGGRKPPHLDMAAVRDAETRGSLSSLSDLIRRATKLASNLDRGRTASRADLAADPEHKVIMGRSTGSLSDILASFPSPGLATADNRSSWPVFFGRSNLHNVEPLGSNDEVLNEKRLSERRCCGMPRKWFIILCIIIFIIVVLAILLPVFLIAVPAQKVSSTESCAKTSPCQNGGVTVSSGTECSCVCSNGYTGSQCIVKGDSSCVTSEVENGTLRKNATMGSSLPSLFGNAQSKFGIELDSITIMALFSLSNVSCKTENSLVSFSDVERSSSNTRRSSVLPLGLPLADGGNILSASIPPTVTVPAIAARAMATSNGILYDDPGSEGPDTQERASPKDSSTATATQISPSATTTIAAKSTTSVPDRVIEFSQVAVLYILQKTGSLSSALFSESMISSYLTDSYSNATHPQMQLLGAFKLDFERMRTSVENGTQS